MSVQVHMYKLVKGDILKNRLFFVVWKTYLTGFIKETQRQRFTEWKYQLYMN